MKPLMKRRTSRYLSLSMSAFTRCRFCAARLWSARAHAARRGFRPGALRHKSASELDRLIHGNL